jgi:hypothetical protein
MRNTSSKEGEVAAAIVSAVPKRITFLESKVTEELDPWMNSRFDWIDEFELPRLGSRWSK